VHAEVTRSQIIPEKADEAITIYRKSVLPVAKKQKGFRGIYLLVDRKAGSFMAIHLWDTERDMKNAETPEYLARQVEMFKGVSANPPTREGFEVAMRD
jgi:heme-degrading monooxygenase HmoA